MKAQTAFVSVISLELHKHPSRHYAESLSDAFIVENACVR